MNVHRLLGASSATVQQCSCTVMRDVIEEYYPARGALGPQLAVCPLRYQVWDWGLLENCTDRQPEYDTQRTSGSK